MALIQRFRAALSALAGRTQEPRTVIIHESLSPPGQGASEDYGYRRLSRDDRRDLSVVAHDRMLKMATWLMASNPIAKRGIQNTTAFVTSEGYKIRATSKDSNSQAIVQRELDKHWKLCAWEDELTQRVTSLGVEGEWAFWAPSRANGHFELCKILPEQVDVIVRDGINAERLKTLHLVQPMRFRWDDGPWERRDAFSLVHEDLWTDQLCGEVLYLGINRLGGQTRGWSDLLPVVDWLDQLDKTLFTEAERVAFQRAFAWDVTLKGADEAKIEARKQKIQEAGPPKPGSVNVHNDSEIWDCKSPDLKLQDSVAFIQFLMMLCFGGLNMPEHFYASGGDVNKATAAEMGTPIWAHIRDRKREIKRFMRQAARLCLQRVHAVGGRLSQVPIEHCTFEVVSRDPDRTAYDLIGAMLKSVGEAQAFAAERNWITQEEAARSYREAASGLGLGDFLPHAIPKSLADARTQGDQALEHRRPQLSLVKPIADPQDQEAS